MSERALVVIMEKIKQRTFDFLTSLKETKLSYVDLQNIRVICLAEMIGGLI